MSVISRLYLADTLPYHPVLGIDRYYAKLCFLMIGMPEFCPMGGPYMPRVIPTSVIRIARMIALAFIAQAMVGPLDAQDAPDVRVVAADQIPAVTHDAPTFLSLIHI